MQGEVSFDDQGVRKIYNLTIFQYRYQKNGITQLVLYSETSN